MIAETLALLAAFLYAVDSVAAKKGLRTSNPWSGVLIGLVWSTPYLWIILLLTGHPLDIGVNAVAVFMLVGLMATAVASTLMIIGIQRIGATLTMPLSNSHPLFAVALSGMILLEPLTPRNIVATGLIVTAVAVLTLKGRGRIRVERNVVFPLIAAVIWGASDVLRKIGLGYANVPILAATIQATFALFVVCILVFGARASEFRVNRNCLFFFGLRGISSGTALILLFSALSLGQVVYISPLIGTTPLFVILLARFFLGEEKLTYRLLLGGVMMVLGVVIITTR